MLASRVLITAGTPDSMYLEDRQEKCLRRKGKVRDRRGRKRTARRDYERSTGLEGGRLKV